MPSSAFPELSYANSAQPRLKRWFIRSVEGLSGRDRYAQLYDIWRSSIVPSGDSIFARMLDLIDVGLDRQGQWPPEDLPTGPLVIVANHPFGIGDGIAVLSLAEQLGRPFKVMINAELLKVPEIEPYSLPIDFAETKEALKKNLAVRHEALRLLKDGVTIVIFPGGGVATAPKGFGRARDLPWKMFPARLIQEAEGDRHPDPFRRTERAAVPSGQPADAERRTEHAHRQEALRDVSDAAHLAADPRIRQVVGQGDRRPHRAGDCVGRDGADPRPQDAHRLSLWSRVRACSSGFEAIPVCAKA